MLFVHHPAASAVRGTGAARRIAQHDGLAVADLAGRDLARASSVDSQDFDVFVLGEVVATTSTDDGQFAQPCHTT
jgi:hypothetical protein